MAGITLLIPFLNTLSVFLKKRHLQLVIFNSNIFRLRTYFHIHIYNGNNDNKMFI